MKDNFRELLEWTEKLTKMPEQEDFDAWEFLQKNRNGSLIIDQLYNFLCLNLKDEAVKNMKMKTRVIGVACWWKFNQVQGWLDRTEITPHIHFSLCISSKERDSPSHFRRDTTKKASGASSTTVLLNLNKKNCGKSIRGSPRTKQGKDDGRRSKVHFGGP